jgi:hypothetical protein
MGLNAGLCRGEFVRAAADHTIQSRWMVRELFEQDPVECSTSWLLETENIGVVADIGVDRDPSIVRHGRWERSS